MLRPPSSKDKWPEKMTHRLGDEASPSPISIDDDDDFPRFLEHAKVDMSSVSPHNGYKRVRFREDYEVRWLTSPNANTEYAVCQEMRLLTVSQCDEASQVGFISVEDILSANREYVKMKIRTGKEIVITKVTARMSCSGKHGFNGFPTCVRVHACVRLHVFVRVYV